MRRFLATMLCLAALIALATSGPASAAAPVPVAFGTSWDGPAYELQKVVDNYLGVPGAINVQTDFEGAKPGDQDPWFWVGDQIPALMITEVAGYSNQNTLGWYKETLVKPVIDGVDDGVIFTGAQGSGATAIISLPGGKTKFGFYLNPNGALSAQFAPEPELFFTNRFYNDRGTDGSGATHAPFDGDVQFLVYDVSRWKGPNTWLVCVEDIDSGAPVTACCSGTDNDFNDMVFQVSALGATPAHQLTFGALKNLYR